MKYSQLIDFNPIEDVIQLISAGDKDKAREYVKSYIWPDKMAESLQSSVIDQLQMDEVIDNKGVLIVGNYGTGKSHLMSVISAIATDEDNLQYLQNKKFAQQMEPIAGKFEVLRIEIGGVVMPLYDVIMGYVQDDFDNRCIDFEAPDYNSVKSLKTVIQNMMMAFSEKYPDKGYLIIVDEFLSYLSSRDEREIVLDLEFFRALGEMCSKSKLRVVFGMQEKIFDNPRFSFVADTLKHVSDRFTQLIITKEATSYVVSERILKKTPEQKAMIRKHLEQFCGLYTGMSSRLEEFVDLFPIHPSYIDVFNKIYLIENRHILKNISVTIKGIFNTDVPQNAPGIISFDDYWPAIKSNGLLKSDVTISRVVNASQQLEDIINRAFPKAAYKPLAKKIIYALSVHRLTTNGLDVQFGLTAENLKDDLCLYLPMPEEDADFLLALIKTTLRDIMTTVSGQFIIYNDANNQYYIDVDKIVDYLTFGRFGTGGWASPDGTINCIEKAYDFNSERFLVSLLKHEAQHTVDMKEFPGITATELEYRAKLVELQYAAEPGLLKKFISEASGERKEDSHSMASERIRVDFLGIDGNDIPLIQHKALELFLAHTEEMKRKYCKA